MSPNEIGSPNETGGETASPSPADGGAWLGKLTDSAKAIFTLVSTSLLLIVLMLCLVVLGREYWTRAVVLDQIDVAEPLQHKLLLGPMSVSKRLADEVQRVQARSTERTSGRKLLEPAWSLPDIQVPGADMSIAAIVNFLKEEFGSSDLHIAGELSQSGGTLRLTLRSVDGDEQFMPIERPVSELDGIIQDGAVEVLRVVDPYVLAAAWFPSESRGNLYPNTLYWIRTALANDFEQTASRAYNLWGNILTNQGKIDEAIQKYALSVQQKRPFAAAYTNWGNALLITGRVHEAILKYRQAVDMDRTIATAHAGWGNAALLVGDYPTAIEQLQIAIAQDPDQIWPYFNLGSVYRVLGQNADALRQYRLAVDKAATRTLVIDEHTDLRTVKVEFADIYAAWANVLNQLHDSAGAAQKAAIAAQINPSLPDAFTQWGDALDAQGRFSEAADKYRAATKINGSFNLGYVSLAGALQDQGLLTEAINMAHRAIDLGPERDAHSALASIMVQQGRYDAAEAEARAMLRINPSSGLAHAILGTSRYKQGDAEGGEAEFRLAFLAWPGANEVYITWGDTLSDLGRDAEALVAYRHAVELDPTDVWARVRVGQSLMALGDYSGAISIFQNAVGMADLADIHTAWGDALAALNRYDEAEAQYRAALKIAPSFAWANAGLGALHSNQDNPGHDSERAMREFQATVRTNPQPGWYRTWGDALPPDSAFLMYQKALDLDPNFAAAHVAWGDKISEPQPAMVQYRDALALNPLLGFIHTRLGDRLVGLGRVDEAITEYRAELRLNPASSMAQHGWCRALAMLGDYRTGIAHCASATRLNALDLGAWLDWGDALLRMGDYAGAIDKYQRALALDAGASQAHSGLGLALLDQGKAVEALRHLDMDFARSGQAVSGYPAFRDAMLAGHYDMYQGSEGDIIINQQLEAPVISQPGTPWFYLQQGDSFAGRAMGLGPSTERDWLAAINQYKQAIAVNANFSQAYREWAVALAGMGKPRRAEEKIELAIRANPFCADCYATWGYILMQRGDLASAAHKLQQAIALRPILVSARIALGNTLERLGRIDEARITYQDILVLSPGSPVAADRLRQLSAIPGSGR